jgi:hypothetical protein
MTIGSIRNATLRRLAILAFGLVIFPVLVVVTIAEAIVQGVMAVKVIVAGTFGDFRKAWQ